MYERFTDRARAVFRNANQVAESRKHDYIGTEHILLALVEDQSCLGAIVVQKLAIDPDAVNAMIRQVAEKEKETPSAKVVIEFAIDEAQRLGHDYVGTEHLLLGLLREEVGIAAQTLRQLKVDLEKARATVREHLAAP